MLTHWFDWFQLLIGMLCAIFKNVLIRLTWLVWEASIDRTRIFLPSIHEQTTQMFRHRIQTILKVKFNFTNILIYTFALCLFLFFYVYIESPNPRKPRRPNNTGPKPHQLKTPTQKPQTTINEKKVSWINLGKIFPRPLRLVLLKWAGILLGTVCDVKKWPISNSVPHPFV